MNNHTWPHQPQKMLPPGGSAAHPALGKQRWIHKTYTPLPIAKLNHSPLVKKILVLQSNKFWPFSKGENTHEPAHKLADESPFAIS